MMRLKSYQIDILNNKKQQGFNTSNILLGLSEIHAIDLDKKFKRR